MEGNYSVSFRNKPCGKVQVLRQGLYYRFICRCQLREENLCRLHVSCGGKQEELGVLIPTESGFGLDKKIPAKYLGEGIPEFRLYTKNERQDGQFVPIIAEEPFSYIAKLKKAYLTRKNGQTGVIICVSDRI